MIPIARRDAQRWVLAALAISSLWLHLYRLDWGLPNAQRSLRVFESERNIAALAPLLVRLREEIYAGYHEMAIDTMKGRSRPGEEISRTMIYNGMRSHLLQPRSTDEPQVIGALSRIKQALKERKRLPFLVYGYAYPGLVGFTLCLAHFLGILTLTPDVAFYLLHPRQMARIYITARLVGALANVCTIGLLYWMVRRWFGWKTAAIAAFLYASHPIGVINSHMAKIWSCAALCSALLLVFCERLWRGSDRRADFWAAGAAGGLAGAMSYLYVLNWIWVPGSRVYGRGWQAVRRDTPILLQSAFIGAGVFLAANAHILFTFPDLLALSRAHGLGKPQSSLLLSSLQDGFLTFPGLLYLPALGLAGLAASRPNAGLERLLWILFGPMLVFYGLCIGGSTHHLFPLYPLLAVLAARGLAYGMTPSIPGMGQNFFRRILSGSLLVLLLTTSLGSSAVWLRDSNSDNLETAGDWIGENIPAGSSIAITHGLPDVNFPPFPFLRYRFSYYPHLGSDRLPREDYVINVHFPTPAFSRTTDFQKNYRLVYSLSRGRFSYASLPVPLRAFAPYAHANIEIWKRGAI